MNRHRILTDLDRTDFLTTGPFSTARVLAALMAHPTQAVAAIRSGRIRRANRSWYDIFGTRSVAPQEPSIASLFSDAKSAERFERVIAAAFEKGAARAEHFLTRADGSTFMAEIVVHLLAGENAFGADAVWQVRDITAERDLRRELREMEEYYRTLSTYQWDLTLVFDRDFYISYVSPSVETVLGYRSSEILGERVDTFFHAEDIAAGRALIRRVLVGDLNAQTTSANLRVRHRSGSYRVLSWRLRNCVDIARIAGVVVNARDITQEVRELDLRHERQAYAVVLREALFDLATSMPLDFSDQMDRIIRTAVDVLSVQGASFWRFDPSRRLFHCEHTHLQSTYAGVSDPGRQEILRDSYPRYVHEIETRQPIVVPDIRDHPALSESHVQRLQRANVGAMLDVPVVREGQTLGIMSLEFAGGPRNWEPEEISFAAGLSLLIALALESAERTAAAARTEFMALHDALTGLANRNRAESALRDAIENAALHQRRVALLLIDLDEFKEINDTFGHGRGDDLLARVARVLVDCAGPGALVARMGGDEFLIVVPDAISSETEALAQSIIERMSTEHLLVGIDQHVGASIGIAVYPEDATDAEALLAHVDIAMYQAKAGGRNQFYAFNSRLAHRLRLQRELDNEIRDALKHQQFSLFYQPQVDLESSHVIGLEALLRWEHPERGLVLPRTFMTVAEHNGLIDSITKWAITEVCEQNMRWQRSGLGTVPISVNITGRQFHDRHLPAIIAGALMRTAMPARHLILEVNEESLLENNKNTERVLTELKRLGVRIAIDDFGVGYSSLNYLRRLVVSQIKLDKAFIESLPGDPESAAIVGAVIAIARRLKYQVIAGGIETKIQVDHLRALGCEAGQGFYFGAPLSAREIAQFMAEQTIGS